MNGPARKNSDDGKVVMMVIIMLAFAHPFDMYLAVATFLARCSSIKSRFCGVWATR